MKKCSLCADPLSKGGKGLCNNKPNLAGPSCNLFLQFDNKSLNVT